MTHGSKISAFENAYCWFFTFFTKHTKTVISVITQWSINSNMGVTESSRLLNPWKVIAVLIVTIITFLCLFNLAYSVHALIMTWHLNCMYCKDTCKLAMNILKMTDFGQKLIQMLAKLFCQNHATFHSLISISICVVSILPNIYFINCEIFLLLRSKKLRWGNRQTEERPETKSIKTSWAWRLVHYQQLSLQISSLTQTSSLQAIKI